MDPSPHPTALHNLNFFSVAHPASQYEKNRVHKNCSGLLLLDFRPRQGNETHTSRFSGLTFMIYLPSLWQTQSGIYCSIIIDAWCHRLMYWAVQMVKFSKNWLSAWGISSNAKLLKGKVRGLKLITPGVLVHYWKWRKWKRLYTTMEAASINAAASLRMNWSQA